MLLVDGELAGVWEHTEAKGRLQVEIRPLAPLAPRIAKLAVAEGERLANHAGLPADITVGGFGGGRGRKNPL